MKFEFTKKRISIILTKLKLSKLALTFFFRHLLPMIMTVVHLCDKKYNKYPTHIYILCQLWLPELETPYNFLIVSTFSFPPTRKSVQKTCLDFLISNANLYLQ